MKRMHLRDAARALRARAGQIAYCGAVALALAAIAFAAERYRAGRAAPVGEAALPAVEFSTPAPEPAEAAGPRAPEGAVLLRNYDARPTWNARLGLWESHPATDYCLEDGRVASLAAGTVRAVGRGGARGGFVEVECGELVLRYASIAPRADLKPGDALDLGDPIGTADASMAGEAALGAHLHLEATLGGESADFEALAEGD